MTQHFWIHQGGVVKKYCSVGKNYSLKIMYLKWVMLYLRPFYDWCFTWAFMNWIFVWRNSTHTALSIGRCHSIFNFFLCKIILWSYLISLQRRIRVWKLWKILLKVARFRCKVRAEKGVSRLTRIKFSKSLKNFSISIWKYFIKVEHSSICKTYSFIFI